MNLKHLSYFVEISKRESFTKTAEDIFISQSALSKAVKSLEQELGVTLIDRANKNFVLTESGKLLLEEGEKLLQYVEESQSVIVEKIQKRKGLLRVGIPPVVSTAYFSYLIYRFLEEHSNIELEIIEAGANVIQGLVDDGKIDIGVGLLPIIHADDYDIIPAMSSENVLIVNKEHSLAERTEVSLKELEHEKFLLLNSDYMLYDRIVGNCKLVGFYPNISTESSQWDFLAEMVALNQGISILPKPIIERFKSGQRIKVIKLTEPELPWKIAMIIKKDKLITEQMKKFTEFVVANKDYFNGD